MKAPALDVPRTGVLVTVSSLRSQISRGIGEFVDLRNLADWCVPRGISIVQILPINDTGVQPSPYSALSAFALHPVYLSIESLPEFQPNISLDSLPKTAELAGPVDFVSIVTEKERVLHSVFGANRSKIAADGGFADWVTANPWVRTYSVFRALRVRNQGRGWTDWPEDEQGGDAELISSLWNSPEEFEREPLFYAWLQYRLEEQLVETSRYLQSRGVYLKGDLPILMNEDSADVWAHPRIFNRDLRAGAPPDMFSDLGQNWDFPVYDWDYLEETGFQWWKARLRQADKYYHAYRIDHVLGFFRIWAIPSSSYSGTLGYFIPYRYLTTADLHSHGFDDGRITWLAEPHLRRQKIVEILADSDSGSVSVEDSLLRSIFQRIGEEDLYRFSSTIRGERDIQGLSLSDRTKQGLLDVYRDRALIRVDADRYFPSWTYRQCSRYQSLAEAERNRFDTLVADAGEQSEGIWEETGRRLLSFMSETADMLTCAEDLGVVPRSVPEVLELLGILGLRIPRWTRWYKKPDEPYLRPNEYPSLTICATSVHDTSTVRGWWEDEADRGAFWRSLGFTDTPPEKLSPADAERLYVALAPVASSVLLFQMQDLFDLDSTVRSDSPEQDRVNVPGTIADTNWSYRWPIALEDLSSVSELATRLDAIVTARTSSF